MNELLGSAPHRVNLDTVLILATFLGIVLLAFGVFGRPSHDRPHCVRCRADVRALAWTESPRCGCGAALDRSGAVRSVGRVRRPRLIWCGAVVWLLTLLVTAETVRLRWTNQSWVTWIPRGVVVSRAVAGDSWALQELGNRKITPETAGELLVREAEGEVTLPSRSILSRPNLLSIWSATQPNADRVMSAILGDLGARGVLADGTISIELGIRQNSTPFAWVVRIEGVALAAAGEPRRAMNDWSLTPRRPPLYSSVGTRSLTGAAVLTLPAATGCRVGDTVEVSILSGFGPLAVGLARSPLFDRLAPAAQHAAAGGDGLKCGE